MKVKLIGQVKSEAVKKEVEGLTDHELFCKKTGIRCLMKECCNEVRRDFANELLTFLAERIIYYNKEGYNLPGSLAGIDLVDKLKEIGKFG